MEQGMKLWPEGLFRDLKRIGVRTANPDDNIEQVLTDIKGGERISYLAYVIEVEGIPPVSERGDQHYEGIRFHYISGRTIDVQLGRLVIDFVLRARPDELYYLDRNPAPKPISLEQEWGAEQERVWKAGL